MLCFGNLFQEKKGIVIRLNGSAWIAAGDSRWRRPLKRMTYQYSLVDVKIILAYPPHDPFFMMRRTPAPLSGVLCKVCVYFVPFNLLVFFYFFATTR